MVFNATFNNISVISVEETGVPGETHRPAASHCQTLSHNVVSSTLTTLVVKGTDCTGSCKSSYNTITTTTAPKPILKSQKNYVHQDNHPFETKVDPGIPFIRSLVLIIVPQKSRH